MHWILLITCCAAVYGGMVAKSPVVMAVCFIVAVASCAAWLWVRYTTLFPGGTAVTAGSAGLDEVEMESLRAHVRAHAQSKAAPVPETLERPADPDAIRVAAQRVAERDAEMMRLREEAERAALALRAAEEKRTLEAARERIAEEDASRLAIAADSAVIDAESTTTVASVPTPAKPQGPEREVGEVWNPYAGVVQAVKKDVQVHPTSGDAHDA